MLLRPEKPVYRVGETMHLTVLYSRPAGTVYVDIVREGQTLSTQRSSGKWKGRAGGGFHSRTSTGTLELHAYKILQSGTITRDTRLVVVDNANDLALQLTPGQEVYRPGDPAKLQVQVNGQNGSGAKAALGLAIVDKSVFALAEQDPGFAKLYFMLEQELLQPKYDLHGFSVPELVKGVPSEDPQLLRTVEDTAQASLAAAAPQTAAFSLVANSHEDTESNAPISYRVNILPILAKAYMGFSCCCPWPWCGLNAFAFWREKSLWSSLAIVIGLLLLLTILFFAWPLGENAQWVHTPLDRLSLLRNWLSDNGGWFVLILALLGSSELYHPGGSCLAA